MEPEIYKWAGALGVGIFAGFIGAMVGSGGLITIPFLIFLGLPAHMAIATHKFGAVGLKIGALTKFRKTDKIKWEYILPFSIIGVISAFAGAKLLLWIDKDLLSNLVIVLLLAVLPIVFLKKEVGTIFQKKSKLHEGVGYVLFFLAMVFSAFFGGGAATFIIYILMMFFGFTIIQSSATAMLPALILNIIALVIFAYHGIVDYQVGFALFLGMMLGGRLGAITAIKKGNKWVKVIFVLVVIALIIKIATK